MNAGEAAVRSSRSKCSAAYDVEVEVELGHGRLHHAPHRLAEVGHEAHELECLDVCRADTSPKYAASSASHCVASSSWLIEKFARSKKRSPMPAYSQSTMQQALAFVQEVRVQEVVVAGDGRVRCASPLDPRGDLVRTIERLGHAPSAVERCLPVGLDHAEGVEHSGNLRTVVERAQRSRHALKQRGLAHPLQTWESLPRRSR